MVKRYEVGEIVNKVGFEVDSKSWKNLEKFEKKISHVKNVMKGLKSNFNVKMDSRMSSMRSFEQKQQRIEKMKDDSQRVRLREEAAAQKKLIREKAKAEKDIASRKESVKAKEIRASTVAEGFGKLDTAEVDRFKKAIAGLGAAYVATSMSTKEYNARTEQLTKQFRTQNKQVRNLKDRFISLRQSVILLTASYSAFQAGAVVTKLGQSFESLESKMRLATGSGEKAQDWMKFAREEALRLGHDLLNTSNQFSKLGIAVRGTLDDAQAKELFTGLLEIGTVAGLTVDEMNRATNAIQQI